ncbi:cytochrome P450 [Aspergillus ambiguus]|uniref:cytochrome P450 n=1 Tax=Aspergillus ambiguus TaxID=176160 RepID=UPI003CCDD7CB
MDTIDALSEWVITIAGGFLLLLVATYACKFIHRAYFHPLSTVPGPKLAATTSLWLAYHTFIGDECTVIFNLHKRYGPVLRVAPNDIDITDGDAIDPIYLARGGFPKTQAYSKFDIDGHSTIFSSLTLTERASRAKAVAPLFSTASIRQSEPALAAVFDDFVERIRFEARAGHPVNVLNAARCMAIDAVTTYLFQQRYGALDEGSTTMSASPFVDAYVGVGALFNLVPGICSDLIATAMEYWNATATTKTAFRLIDAYTSNLVKTPTPKSGSYQSRLLERQICEEQSRIELKDVCFAGTDSTGMNMATIMWNLAKYPDVYARLRQELHDSAARHDDLTSCAYLRAVIREALRLSWANPIRLPRVVPPEGWTFKGFFFPAGTSVGVAAFQLHQNEAVFPDAQRFLPERWLQPTDAMLNDFFAFGKGTRACIAQNLGSAELTWATIKVVQADLLQGARIVDDEIRILEWFNSRVKGEKILIQFDVRS